METETVFHTSVTNGHVKKQQEGKSLWTGGEGVLADAAMWPEENVLESFVSWLNELCWVMATFSSSLCVVLMGLCLVQGVMYNFL